MPGSLTTVESNPDTANVTDDDVDLAVDLFVAEMLTRFRRLKSEKAPGPGCIPADMLKYADEIAPEIYALTF